MLELLSGNSWKAPVTPLPPETKLWLPSNIKQLDQSRNMNMAKPFTIAAWFNFTNDKMFQLFSLGAYASAGGWNAVHAGITLSAGHFQYSRAYLIDSAGVNDPTFTNAIPLLDFSALGVWTHIAVEVQSNNQLQLAVNGVFGGAIIPPDTLGNSNVGFGDPNQSSFGGIGLQQDAKLWDSLVWGGVNFAPPKRSE